MANPGSSRPHSLPPLDQSEGPLPEDIGPMLQLFPNLDDEQLYGDNYDYNAAVRAIIEDARDYDLNYLAPAREYAQQLYEGLIPAPVEEGRSSVVMSEVRDLVLAMLPSLLRLFATGDAPCNFVPRTEADVPLAKEARDYINYVYNYDNDGFLITNALLKDALIKKTGIAKWWTEQEVAVQEMTYTRMSLQQRQYIISQPDVRVVNEEQITAPHAEGFRPGEPTQGPGGNVVEPRFNLTVRRINMTPKHRVEAVPPEEFRISREAKNVRSAALVGHERQVPLSQLVAMGYHPEQLNDYLGSTAPQQSLEADLRNPGGLFHLGGKDPRQGDPLVLYGEWFIRIDKDGDGVPELRMICTLGDGDVIVKDEPAPRARFALFCPDPEPHTAIGNGIADQVEDLQKIKTNVLRNMLDAVASTILPRLVVVDTMANMDDVTNNELGSIIRVKDANAVQALKTGDVGQTPLTLLQYMDTMAMRRTGVTEQSKGIDPKALQSTSTPGVQMLVQGAQERTVLVAQTLAQTGFRDLFKGLLQEIVENPVPERVIRLRGSWTKITPDQFDVTMDVEVNPAMGKGSDADRLSMLTGIKQTQEEILKTQGAGNPLVTPMEYRNTIQDLLEMVGLMDVGRYFRAVTEQQLQAALKQASEKPNAEMVLAQAEADKVRAQVVKTLTDARVKLEETKLKDDRDRDKVEAETAIEAAKLGMQGSQQSFDAIKATLTEPRPEAADIDASSIPDPASVMQSGTPGAPISEGLPNPPMPGSDGGNEDNLARVALASKLAGPAGKIAAPPNLNLPPGFGKG